MKRVDAHKEKRRLANKLKYEGYRFKTKTGECEVVEYTNNENVLVRFVNTGYEKVVKLKAITCGNVRDCTASTVYGVGIVGETTLKTKGKDAVEYVLWKGMLARCYDDNIKQKYPSYDLSGVVENFKHFEKFINWCSEQIGYGAIDEKGRKFNLDKDILVKGNKLYSEDTCCFVPHEINAVLTHRKKVKSKYPIGVSFNKSKGKFEAYCCSMTTRYLGTYLTPEEAFEAYKRAKENHIQYLANKWVDHIDPRAYEALINYRVEITD